MTTHRLTDAAIRHREDNMRRGAPDGGRGRVVELHLTPLYVDDGRRIATHSMLQCFGQCPKRAQYKYAERLKKKTLTMRDQPLRRGTWVHRLMEVHYSGGDWKAEHEKLTKQFNQLMDVEKDALGDLPAECLRLMRSYLWHYGADKSDPLHGWKVLDTELTLECPWPDGEGVYRCRLDLLVEDRWGLAIVDHKTHKRLPDFGHRLRDAASALYLWCAQYNGLDVSRFIWNYIRTRPPTVPQLVDVKRTPRLSTKSIDTDYPTMLTAIRDYGLDPEDYRDRLIALKRQRWKRDAVQTSTFFRRTELDKDDDLLTRVLASSMRTRDRMDTYDWEQPEAVERVTGLHCGWCDFKELCETELFTGDGRMIRHRQFRTGDPLDYYHDQKDTDD